MLRAGREVTSTGDDTVDRLEREPFSRSQMDDLIELARQGIAKLIGLQKAVIDSSK